MKTPQPSWKPRFIVVLCLAAWVVFLISPRAVIPLAIAVYVGIGLVLGWSALRHHGQGWGAGLLFALLLITLPVWVISAYWLFELYNGRLGNTVNAMWPF